MNKYKNGGKMGEIIDINKNQPHAVSEVICVRCCKRWISVRPNETLLKQIKCPNCGKGAVVETGQPIEII